MSPYCPESSLLDVPSDPTAPTSAPTAGPALDWNPDRLHRPGWTRRHPSWPAEPVSDDAFNRNREK